MDASVQTLEIEVRCSEIACFVRELLASGEVRQHLIWLIWML